MIAAGAVGVVSLLVLAFDLAFDWQLDQQLFKMLFH
jgi:hypothetical protein